VHAQDVHARGAYLQTCFSPDGWFLVAASPGDPGRAGVPGLAVVWGAGARDWAERCRFRDEYLGGDISVVPAGRLIAASDKLWDAATGRLVRRVGVVFGPEESAVIGPNNPDNHDKERVTLSR
jgi:hypothetical protein